MADYSFPSQHISAEHHHTSTRSGKAGSRVDHRILKRSLSASDVQWTVRNAEDCHHLHEDGSDAHLEAPVLPVPGPTEPETFPIPSASGVAERGCPPPLPPRPENVESEMVLSKERWPTPSRHLDLHALWALAKRKNKPKPNKSETQRGVQTATDDFVRDRSGYKRTAKHAREDVEMHVMSGALTQDGAETESAGSFMFSSPSLPESDTMSVSDAISVSGAISEPTLRPLLDSQDSLNQRCDGADPSPTDDVDVRLTQAMHQLSPSVSVSGSHYDPGAYMVGRQCDLGSIDAILSKLDHGSDGRSVASDVSSTALPSEMIQDIYSYLGPHDFNAARHTCRYWRAASLRLQMLTEQLKRGGWWSAASSELLPFREWRPWVPTSSYLARECALSGNWTGRGVSAAQGAEPCNPMIESCSVDLSAVKQETVQAGEVVEHYAVVCTTSICGRYFLLAAGSSIYAYEVEKQSLRLISKTSCERPVQALAMSVTSERFAIAAVLEGRTGLYLDLLSGSQVSPVTSPSESAESLAGTTLQTTNAMATTVDDATGACGVIEEVPIGDFDELSLSAESLGSNTILHQSVERLTQHSWSQSLHDRLGRLRGIRQLPSSRNGVWPAALDLDLKGKGKNRQAITTRPQIVWRNVCSEDDPPYSVAISPTRQCTAFGCKGGVELYWIDPVTGQHLSRWFRLARPSDHLYFLPPRESIDNPSRLQLLSTATSNYQLISDAGSTLSSQGISWFASAGSWRLQIPYVNRNQAQKLDHSYALPLSDGHHILFTDDSTGLLCLGSDMPTGNQRRLSRKFTFQSPMAADSRALPPTPTVYAAAANLGNGARIAAGFGSDIVLFSVPIDALRYSTAEQERTVQDSASSFEDLKWLELLPHPTSNALAIPEVHDQRSTSLEKLNMKWVHYLPASGSKKPTSLDDLWPLEIPGTRIGSLEDLRALSIQATALDGLVIWAFSASAAAKVWQVDDGQRPTTYTRKIAGADGVVFADEAPG